MESKERKDQRQKGERNYPGVAIDTSDGEKVDNKLVKERTRALNNNPRNDQ